MSIRDRPKKPVSKIVCPAAEQNSTQENNTEPKTRVRVVGEVPSSPQYHRDATEREKNSRKWWETVLASIPLVVSLLALVVSYGSHQAASRSAATAQQNMELTQRPWLTTEPSLYTPVTFYEGGQAYVGVRVLLKNVSHSVAVRAFVKAKIVPFSHRDGLSYDMMRAPEWQRNSLCEEWSRGAGEKGGGWVIFPGQKVSTRTWIFLGNETDLEEWAITHSHEPGKFISLIVVGCVNYQSSFSSKRHVTGFMYSLWSTIHDGDIRLGETLPLEKIRLVPYVLPDSYID